MNLRRDVSKALVAEGYERDGRMHRLQISPDWWFLTDTGPIGKSFDIAPFVAIRHDPTEQLVQQLVGLPEYAWSGTVGGNIGYILGTGYTWWTPPSKAPEVLSAIGIALERLQSFATLDRLPEAWENIPETWAAPGWHYSEIVVFLQRREYQMVLKKLQEACKYYCAREDMVCDQFRGFERRVLDLLSS